MPERFIRHALGFVAEIDIQPRKLGKQEVAKQTVRIRVDKTSEAVLGCCYASSDKQWVSFNGEDSHEEGFDPEDGKRSRWGKRELETLSWEITVKDDVAVPQVRPETVAVRLGARAKSSREGQEIFAEPPAYIDLKIA